jgi:hypothetical protein
MDGAGAWLIFSQSRQVNFSRTCWITFHCRGMTSSVSVMSSPNLRSRGLPQHKHCVGPGSTTRSRGRCSGKGWRAGALAGKGQHIGGPGHGPLGRDLVLGGRTLELLKGQLDLVEQPHRAFRAAVCDRALEQTRNTMPGNRAS